LPKGADEVIIETAYLYFGLYVKAFKLFVTLPIVNIFDGIEYAFWNQFKSSEYRGIIYIPV